MTQQTPIQRAGIGLPVARLMDVHDMLTLALDATEGTSPQFWQLPEARGYIRNAMRQVNRLLPKEGGRQ
jgi:hypothetical protein